MTALVRETIGFNKDRGDSVNLMNAPFLVETSVQRRTADVEAARDAGPGAQLRLAGRAWC